MGKSCVRFKSLDDLPLELIGEAIGKVPLDEFVATFEKNRTAVREKKPVGAQKPRRARSSGA